MKITTSLIAAAIVIQLSVPLFSHAGELKDIHKLIVKNVDMENGKSIYEHGKRFNGPRIAFNGGPHWMRTENTGCQTCHGPKGIGGVLPDYCTTTSPPITYKYLKGSGYSFVSRRNGNHPAYNKHTLKNALKTGFKSNGFEMDYCMPRWRLIDKDFLDLLGYLHTLDAEH